MFADLHLHSIYSDGLYSPDEICARAKIRGLSLLSITDHDTLQGEEAKIAAAKKHGLQYVSGWEISAYLQGEKMHVLGYGCEGKEGYQVFNERRKNAALLRAEDSVEKLRKLGVDITMDEVMEERLIEDAPLHTMHVVRAAAKAMGLTPTQTYEEYFNYGKAAHSEIGRPTPKESIDCIHECGGIAVLAHPGRITFSQKKLEETIVEFADYGLDGIEAAYTTHTERETEYFIRLATRLNLLVTGGSDTHYESDTHQIGAPRFTPSQALLDRLKIKK